MIIRGIMRISSALGGILPPGQHTHTCDSQLSLVPATASSKTLISNWRQNKELSYHLKLVFYFRMVNASGIKATNGHANGHAKGNGNGVVNGHTNGVNGHKPLKKSQPSKAWKALSQCLPPRDPDADRWWQITGQHLAAMCEAAGYPVEKQYEVLLMHHQYTVG